MNRKFAIALALVFAVGLVGCTGNVPASATIAPTQEPTESLPPTAVPTEVPTATPTESPTIVPTPKATTEPTVWDIAETMLAECAVWGSDARNTGEYYEKFEEYLGPIVARVREIHPEGDFPLECTATSVRFARADYWISGNDGNNANPFSWMELQYPVSSTSCAGYVLLLENISENFDNDGIFVGEAYLFYEVGGTQPYVLDGELKEVHFTFPPVP